MNQLIFEVYIGNILGIGILVGGVIVYLLNVDKEMKDVQEK